jgi:hypothetical protein
VQVPATAGWNRFRLLVEGPLSEYFGGAGGISRFHAGSEAEYGRYEEMVGG